ncbi:SUMF1/EgtB/PvdO family nonheme iron enzyme [bacterium]|nr:SUMF1/EgtB/PvdO family nonheme iron enzyme [bacterium]
MKLGPYEALEEVGRGGMGVVLRGRSPEGRDVAIKVLHRRGNDALVRFERERRLLASLGDEGGFVPLLDFGDTARGPYIVMPFLTGGTLRDRLTAEPLSSSGDVGPRLSVEETIELGRSLASALGRAHARGIVHRDLKPENILFDGKGAPAIADLGLAKHFREDVPGASMSVSLSRAGEFRGTVGYTPPEQIDDAKSATAAADVFSLGAILYECLAGLPAFAAGSALELMVKVHSGELKPLRSLRPDTPPWLARTIERALSRDPRARFSDGSAFAEALATRPPEKPRRTVAIVAVALAGIVAATLGAALLLRDRDLDRAAALATAKNASERAADSLRAKPRSKSVFPEWYLALPEPLRPRRLPDGVSFGKKPGEYVNEADGSVLVFVPAGSFQKGGPLAPDSSKAHTLPYFIGKLEVTNEKFAAFVAATRYRTLAEQQGSGMIYHANSDVVFQWQATDGASWRDPEGEKKEPPGDHPVVQVARPDALEYAKWARARLPDEIEWEKAASWDPASGRTQTFQWGEELPRAGSRRFANLGDKQHSRMFHIAERDEYDDGVACRAPAGSFELDRSPVGALDMGGNVSEWCSGSSGGASSMVEAVPCRGASWCEVPSGAQASKAHTFTSETRSNVIGFRIALSADAK